MKPSRTYNNNWY